MNRYTIFALAPMLFYLASAGFAFLKRGSELELLIVAGVSAAFAVISLILGIASRGGDYYYEDDDEDEVMKILSKTNMITDLTQIVELKLITE